MVPGKRRRRPAGEWPEHVAVENNRDGEDKAEPEPAPERAGVVPVSRMAAVRRYRRAMAVVLTRCPHPASQRDAPFNHQHSRKAPYSPADGPCPTGET